MTSTVENTVNKYSKLTCAQIAESIKKLERHNLLPPPPKGDTTVSDFQAYSLQLVHLANKLKD